MIIHDYVMHQLLIRAGKCLEVSRGMKNSFM